ncbi:cytochrome PufQ [Maritimibacter sp. UBA3975]|uniref:cytochrome PufQ n=1 Tax=Maritimibacter sp. UBA3975 TaxID=1946833 RepID=UPI000C08F35A|nr:cytochrome PufQ [Maritimibacter sp. UBA3975]MAM62925.1 protein pufQ [Maritimibacter sp.]|tara:strand:+ start:1647 stop:1871 length:225 start_codon:yes stop_codon:yes gene_type:complete
MTVFSSNPPPRRRAHSRRSPEFIIYFTLIFCLAIPMAWLAWVRDVIRLRSLNHLGPLARAWSDADRITPMIFSV